MDLRVDDEALRVLVSKSIVELITPETREKLIQDAVKYSITRPTDSRYGDKRSPIQTAFDYAVSKYASEYAAKLLESDTDFRRQIEQLFADVAKKIFDSSENRINLVSEIAGTITKALTKDRY